MKAFKTKRYNIQDLKNESKMPTILSLWSQGFMTIIVNDLEFNDDYKILLSKSNEFQIEGSCHLNGRPSYKQADFQGVSKDNNKTLASVINAIANGEIIKENGCLVDRGEK